MFSQRQLSRCLILSLALTGSSEAQFNPLNWFHKKPKATQQAKTSKASKPDKPSRPWQASTLLHTRAVFVYGGKVIAPADYANAVLYNATDPAAGTDVDAMDGARSNVQRAQHICQTFIPGRDLTTGPGGGVYFDYVYSGSYWIFVCAQVQFSGNSHPIWVSGLVPVQRVGFNEANSVEYNVPDEIQIVLDPYAKELNATPTTMPTELAMADEAALPLKVPFVPPAPFPLATAAPTPITATAAAFGPLPPTATHAPDSITAPSATLIRTPGATHAPDSIAAPTATLIRTPGATAEKPAIAAPTTTLIRTPQATESKGVIAAPTATPIHLPGAKPAPTAITAPTTNGIHLPGAMAAPPPITVNSTTPVATPQAAPAPPPIAAPGANLPPQ